MPRPFRIVFVPCALVALTALPLPAQVREPSPGGGRRPNVVLIVADDLGWNGVGYHGGPAKTPHIDRIARSGVELDRFYVSPMCSPTRAGLLTGRYPMRYGMARTVVRPWIRNGLPPEERTLPESLAEAGYARRGAFGKWHLGHLAPQWHPLSQGFTDFKGCYNGAADYFTRQRDGQTDWHENWEPVEEPGYTTDLIADAAAAFVRRHATDGPFFCYVAFTAPHDPLQAPARYLAQYAHLDADPNDRTPSREQRLAAMTACMDDGIGRILQSLQDAGVARDTLVWFMSDNGGIGSIPKNNAPLRGAKLTVYEGGVRVPSAVWWPGVVEGGRNVETPIINLDVMPTVLRACGAAAAGADRPLDGRDVLDVLAGKPATGPLASRDLYFFDGQAGLDREQLAVTTGDGWKLVVVGPDVRRPGRWKTPEHRTELFRLSTDPLEKTDLAAKEPRRVEELARKLVEFRKSEPHGSSMAPVNRKPPRFQPPARWRNTRDEGAGAGRPQQTGQSDR
jgi:arylsulfatase B